MAAFLKADIEIKRQEGDTSDIKIIIPELIDMAGRQPKFQVKDGFGKVLIDNPETIVQGQEIRITLNAQSTKGKSGSHQWELELTGLGEVITIAGGRFIIVKELIK